MSRLGIPEKHRPHLWKLISTEALPDEFLSLRYRLIRVNGW
jgi:hypothetical protein